MILAPNHYQEFSCVLPMSSAADWILMASLRNAEVSKCPFLSWQFEKDAVNKIADCICLHKVTRSVFLPRTRHLIRAETNLI